MLMLQYGFQDDSVGTSANRLHHSCQIHCWHIRLIKVILHGIYWVIDVIIRICNVLLPFFLVPKLLLQYQLIRRRHDLCMIHQQTAVPPAEQSKLRWQIQVL